MTIDEAIAEIRTKWAIPVRSIPELRRILEELVAPDPEKEAAKQRAFDELLRPRCGERVWPYTENNVCVLEPHDTGYHKDARGRPFNHATYVKEES